MPYAIFFLPLLLALLMPAHLAAADMVGTNNPAVQLTRDIHSIPATHMGRIEQVEVAPTGIGQMSFSDYVLETAGYSQVTVSLIGKVASVEHGRCRVGVLMLPREKTIVEAWKKNRFLGLVDEVSAGVGEGELYVQGQLDLDIKFPVYVLGFYNTCPVEVSLSLYSYLK